jgi:hypothetical protein
MKMNLAMARHFDRIRPLLLSSQLASALRNRASSPLVWVGEAGKIVLARECSHNDALVFEASLGAVLRLPESTDATGIEAFLNKVHVGDFLDRETSCDGQLVQGILFAQALSDRLVRLARPSRIVVGYDPDSEDTTVRFFLRRPEQPWGADDPSDYQMEEIIHFDIDPDEPVRAS